MRGIRRRAWPIALLLLFGGIGGGLVACGGPSEAEKKKAHDEQIAAAQRAEQRRKDAAEAKRQAAAHERAVGAAQSCLSSTRPLVKILAEVDSRLGIGMNYDEYTDRVGDIKVAYDNADFAHLDGIRSLPCLRQVAVPAERAFNQHAKAAQAWTTCFNDDYCSNDSVKPTLQKYWLKASLYTERARSGMRKQQTLAGS